MVDFDKLNRETREHNNRNVSRFNTSTPSYGTSAYWQTYWNNQTYKANNGQFVKHYY